MTWTISLLFGLLGLGLVTLVYFVLNYLKPWLEVLHNWDNAILNIHELELQKQYVNKHSS